MEKRNIGVGAAVVLWGRHTKLVTRAPGSGELCVAFAASRGGEFVQERSGGAMAEDDDMPRDAKMVKTILESMGVTRFEPRVINQFLDLWYRYVVDVLGDAQTYSEHAGKTAIDCDDVKLAIQSRVNSSFQQPPPREVYSHSRLVSPLGFQA